MAIITIIDKYLKVIHAQSAPAAAAYLVRVRNDKNQTKWWRRRRETKWNTTAAAKKQHRITLIISYRHVSSFHICICFFRLVKYQIFVYINRDSDREREREREIKGIWRVPSLQKLFGLMMVEEKPKWTVTPITYHSEVSYSIESWQCIRIFIQFIRISFSSNSVWGSKRMRVDLFIKRLKRRRRRRWKERKMMKKKKKAATVTEHDNDSTQSKHTFLEQFFFHPI